LEKQIGKKEYDIHKQTLNKLKSEKKFECPNLSEDLACMVHLLLTVTL
jgi:hypothetical protein